MKTEKRISSQESIHTSSCTKDHTLSAPQDLSREGLTSYTGQNSRSWTMGPSTLIGYFKKCVKSEHKKPAPNSAPMNCMVKVNILSLTNIFFILIRKIDSLYA